MNFSRQLAAIMFTDIAGYTALMQEDEVLAIRLQQKMKIKLESEVALHQGRILEFKGDGALCCFNSALAGVQAAMALQLEMQNEPVVPLRIAIHTGDIMMNNGQVYGDGVNIASRLESFSVPGSIFISGKVYDDIKNQKEIQTISLGQFSLKNVKEQVEIFAISNPGLKVPDAALLQGKGERIIQKSILVLPFVNMSNDAGQDYFSDGLTEELISHLSRLKDIKVISRTTSMLYKNTNKNVKSIRGETGASHILEGSVRKHENNLRITAQFVDAAQDMHIWADNYRGTMDDIFEIQEKVSAKIVEALRMQLTRSEKTVFRKRYTENIEAYELYLQGRFFWKKRNDQGLKSAAMFFEKAIQKDPDYALAWAGLADTCSLMGEYTNIPRKELFPKQRAAVDKALQIDDQLGEAHISLAILLMMHSWDWEGSGKEFRLGVELSPNYATGHHWYAQYLLFTGNIEESFREIAMAVELDPVSQGILKDMGIHYYYTRQYDKAIEMAVKTQEIDPGFAASHRLLSLAYEGKGMYEEAIEENQKWKEKTGNTVKTSVALAQIYAASGRHEAAKKIIENPVIIQNLGSNDHRGMALVYTTLGDADKAFEWIEKSIQHSEESLCSINIDPKFESLRSDPRFGLVLKKIGLEK